MFRIVIAIIIAAALVFVGVSGVMNAVFLASLGSTRLEAGLLIAFSVANDAAKVALPVIVVHAFGERYMFRFIAACVMMIVVVTVSVLSGLGFVATLREVNNATHEASKTSRAALQVEAEQVEQRLSAVAMVPAAAVITQELTAAETDRQFLWSAQCTAPKTVATRRYCADLQGKRIVLAQAEARDALLAERARIGRQRDELGGGVGLVDGEAQVATLAAAAGVTANSVRAALAVGLAVVLEIGSFVLISLAAALTANRSGVATPVEGKAEALGSGLEAGLPVPLPVNTNGALYWQRQRFSHRLGKDAEALS